MDFALNDAQIATRDLAKQILGDLVAPERHREMEKAGEWFDRKTWQALADAGLLAIALPEAHGGSGLGFLEIALVLEEIGRTVAKVPYFASIVLGALPIAEFGSADQQAAWLPRLGDGSAVATAALVEGEPTTATAAGDSWTLSGRRDFVPAGCDADVVLVPATTPSGTTVFLVDPASAGVEVVRQDTSTGIPEAQLVLRDAPVIGVVGSVGGGDAVVDWITLRGAAALASISAGVCEAALRITAEYTKTRYQFGRPIATFQAVSQRAGDAYIDTEAVRLTALQAAWRISEGLPADDAVAIAKFWAADGGNRVVHAAQHLHGGMGVDRDYPVHRYFLWAKWIELTFGGATHQLLRFGRSIAAS